MTSAIAQGEVLLGGTARGEVLRLDRPISFWGGVDPTDGRIVDPRHPQHGESVAGRVVLISETIGSSSSSAVMLELIAQGRAPAAVVLGRPDAILALGVVVARELGHRGLPILRLPTEEQDRLPAGRTVDIDAEGRIVPQA